MSDTNQQDLQQEKRAAVNSGILQQKDEFGGADYTTEEFTELVSMYEGTLNDISENEIITGRVVQINNGDVSIDIGFKSEGIVSLNEFSNHDELKPGNEIEVFLEKVEDKEGKLVLSRRRADFIRVWEKILKSYENQEVLKCTILRRIKGGFVVDLLGVESFLPGSQVDVRPVRDFDTLISKELDVRVVKISHTNENVVVSHKVLLEESLAKQREEILVKLEKGLVLQGLVKAITDFGVFVDLGGVDGLVHITDLAWGRVNHPSEVVDLDQEIEVVVLEYDEERKRISLGLKQLTSHPWDDIDVKIEVGQVITGKVVSLTDYGAFVEIAYGIEGLIHISEMSWTQHIKHPSQIVALGQMVECKVLNIDKDEKKISLGLKQLEPDPWNSLLEKYPIGTISKGIVRNIANFGVFVELEPGIDGLVHISDLSWTKKLRHPSVMLKQGDEIDVLVMGIEPEQRRISLGHKQVLENPWEQFGSDYDVGSFTKGNIVRIIEKGVIVELPLGVDGFVPTSQLAFAPVKEISEYFKVGDELPLHVIEFDSESKKIMLSVVEALKGMDAASQEEYFNAHPVPKSEPDSIAEAQQQEETSDSSKESTDSIHEDEAVPAGTTSEEKAPDIVEPTETSEAEVSTPDSDSTKSEESPEVEAIAEAQEQEETSDSSKESTDSIHEDEAVPAGTTSEEKAPDIVEPTETSEAEVSTPDSDSTKSEESPEVEAIAEAQEQEETSDSSKESTDSIHEDEAVPAGTTSEEKAPDIVEPTETSEAEVSTPDSDSTKSEESPEVEAIKEETEAADSDADENENQESEKPELMVSETSGAATNSIDEASVSEEATEQVEERAS